MYPTSLFVLYNLPSIHLIIIIVFIDNKYTLPSVHLIHPKHPTLCTPDTKYAPNPLYTLTSIHPILYSLIHFIHPIHPIHPHLYMYLITQRIHSTFHRPYTSYTPYRSYTSTPLCILYKVYTLPSIDLTHLIHPIDPIHPHYVSYTMYTLYPIYYLYRLSSIHLIHPIDPYTHTSIYTLPSILPLHPMQR